MLQSQPGIVVEHGPPPDRDVHPVSLCRLPTPAGRGAAIERQRPCRLTLLSTAHDLADARIHRISAALARADVDHALVALGESRSGPSTADHIRPLTRRGVWGRLWRALTAPWHCSGALMVIDPEAVPAAFVATRIRRRPLIVDVHEAYAKVARDRRWARGPLRLIARSAARFALSLAGRAELTSVADDHLAPMTARRRLVVRNLPRLNEFEAATRAATPRAIYIGDVRPSRGLFTMLDAVALAPGWELDIVGNLAEVSPSTVTDYLRRAGIDDRVRLHGRLPPTDAWALAQGAWCGLALLQDTPAYREALPTKVYEYLASGIPVLASNLPRVGDLLRRVDAGRLADEAEDVAAILREWRTSPSQLDVLAANARTWAESELVNSSPFDELATAALELLTPDEAFDDHEDPPER